MSQTVINLQKQITPEDERRNDLYRIKLQCLADVLSKESVVHKQDALLTAKAINAAFDEITF